MGNLDKRLSKLEGADCTPSEDELSPSLKRLVEEITGEAYVPGLKLPTRSPDEIKQIVKELIEG